LRTISTGLRIGYVTAITVLRTPTAEIRTTEITTAIAAFAQTTDFGAKFLHFTHEALYLATHIIEMLGRAGSTASTFTGVRSGASTETVMLVVTTTTLSTRSTPTMTLSSTLTESATITGSATITNPVAITTFTTLAKSTTIFRSISTTLTKPATIAGSISATFTKPTAITGPITEFAHELTGFHFHALRFLIQASSEQIANCISQMFQALPLISLTTRTAIGLTGRPIGTASIMMTKAWSSMMWAITIV
jgi:hypothetical protein